MAGCFRQELFDRRRSGALPLVLSTMIGSPLFRTRGREFISPFRMPGLAKLRVFWEETTRIRGEKGTLRVQKSQHEGVKCRSPGVTGMTKGG